ncbi:MAG: hypothetical protein KUG77_07705 [Nannocystaceae bacterium]|nr:hypothetical protein [Nannocystaceae bacterium]
MFKRRSLSFPILLCLVLTPACDAKNAAESAPAEDKKADTKANNKGDGAKQAKPATAAEAPVKAAEIELVSRDITADVSEFFPSFKGGKIEMNLPKDATFKQGVAGFSAQLDTKVFAVEVGPIHATKKVVADIEAGSSLLKEAEIVEKGEGFVIQKGSYFGEKGHSLNFDLPPMGGLKTGCRTPTGRLYPEATIRKALEACKSFKVTK